MEQRIHAVKAPDYWLDSPPAELVGSTPATVSEPVICALEPSLAATLPTFVLLETCDS